MGESLKDIKFSWQIFKKNFKPYFVNQAITLGVVYFAIFSVNWVFSAFLYAHLQDSVSQNLIRTIFFEVLPFVLYSPLLGSLYGISFDIMSTGDEFAEVKGIFLQFRKYGWQYLIFGSMVYIPIILVELVLSFPLVLPNITVAEGFLVYIPMAFASHIFFMQIGPGIRTRNSLSAAMRDNFRSLRLYLKRLTITWAIACLIYNLPYVVVEYIAFFDYNFFVGNPVSLFLLYVAYIFAIFWFFFVGMPMQSIIATRIYNTMHKVSLSKLLVKITNYNP